MAQEFSTETTQSTRQKLTLWQQEVVRFTHALPKTGYIPDWKTNEALNMSTNIYEHIYIFIFVFSYAENLGIKNMPKLYK